MTGRTSTLAEEDIVLKKRGYRTKKWRGYCPKKEGKLSEKKRGNCTKKEGISCKKVERISCDAQSGEDSDRLERKVDDLKSTKLQME